MKNAPKELLPQILLIVERRVARTRLLFVMVNTVVGVSSLFSLVFSISYLTKTIAESELSSYLSLIGSDAEMLLTYWKEFTYSCLESLPLVGTLFVLVSFGIFIVSLKNISKYAEKNLFTKLKHA